MYVNSFPFLTEKGGKKILLFLNYKNDKYGVFSLSFSNISFTKYISRFLVISKN